MNYLEKIDGLSDSALLETKKLEEKGNAPEIKNITNPLSGEVTKTLSDPEKFLGGMKGLIIDADSHSGILAQTYLGKLGAQSIYLQNLELIENSLNNREIDFIIFCPHFKRDKYNDIRQEDIEFLAFMKEHHKDVPIFAYTANIMAEEMESLRSLEFADIITKPTNLSKFGNSLKQQLRPNLYKRSDNILSQYPSN